MEEKRAVDGSHAALLVENAALQHAMRELRNQHALLAAESESLRLRLAALEALGCSRSVQTLQRLGAILRRIGIDPIQLANLVFGRR